MPKFLYGRIEIGDVSNGSVVAAGDNVHADVQSYTKSNEGFGAVAQARRGIAENHALLNDRDAIDAAALRRKS
ncbi:hypothetical protein [Alicyclobacillus acidiphilus]|uniref:hypothetical protein n=1 Tax=Alicyclobacillus acidiphilus TaxID=182455 RepID=UPI00082ADCD1|nr:hypothetical protein [Alicyclobacillus acidiphilus]